MKILAIESSCDETAAAVIEDGRKILSSVVDTQIATHALYGGVVPEIASRRHMEAVVRVTEQALKDAEMDKHDVDAVAATCAPGLIGALLVGANFGKSLAFAMNKPFIPVHHIRGHIAATYLAYPELKPPFLTLIASGGHSEIVMVKSYTEFEILGGTRDDAAGEAFDKVAPRARCRLSGRPEDRQAGAGRRCEDVQAAGFAHHGCAAGFSPSRDSKRRSSIWRTTPSRRAKPSTGTVLRPRSARLSCIRSCRGSRWPSSRRMRGALCVRAAWQPTLSCGRPCRTWQKREHVQLFMQPLQLCGDNAAMIGSQAYYEYQAGTRGKNSAECVRHRGYRKEYLRLR